MVCEGSQVGESGKVSVEGSNVWAIYLANALKVTKDYVEEVSTHLIERKHSIINVPVLHIDFAMRGIRHTINRDLELLSASLGGFGANLLSAISRFHRKKWVGNRVPA